MSRSRQKLVARYAVMACIASVIALSTSPAPAATKAAVTRFGSKLTINTQPSNCCPPHKCSPHPADPCTRVMMEAYGRPDGGEKAPKEGVIGKIRLIAGAAGHFQLQIARARASTQTARVVRNGPRIDYQGTNPNGSTFTIESFKVNVPVHKGDHLAIKGNKTSLVRCSSGGPNILIFQPPLAPGGAFQKADDDDGCWLLLEAVYK